LATIRLENSNYKYDFGIKVAGFHCCMGFKLGGFAETTPGMISSTKPGFGDLDQPITNAVGSLFDHADNPRSKPPFLDHDPSFCAAAAGTASVTAVIDA
jgi:hypothetical protein